MAGLKHYYFLTSLILLGSWKSWYFHLDSIVIFFIFFCFYWTLNVCSYERNIFLTFLVKWEFLGHKTLFLLLFNENITYGFLKALHWNCREIFEVYIRIQEFSQICFLAMYQSGFCQGNDFHNQASKDKHYYIYLHVWKY